MERERCGHCGMEQAMVEFHPLLFCILFKGGIEEPARFVAESGFRLSSELQAHVEEWGWPIQEGLVEERQPA